MADTFQLEVATPEREWVNEQVREAQIPGQKGYLGVLAGHAPLLSALGAGLLTYSSGAGSQSLLVAGGFVEISDNNVRVLADVAELPKDINAEQARRELESASKQLREAKTEDETDRANKAFQRAQAEVDASAPRAPEH